MFSYRVVGGRRVVMSAGGWDCVFSRLVGNKGGRVSTQLIVWD